MTISILTEKTPVTGHGHFHRCSALQSAFRHFGHSCSLYLNEFQNYTKKVDCVIVDSYNLTYVEYQQLFTFGNVGVVIDDNCRITYPTACIVNPTLGSEQLQYVDQDKSTLLLGSQYALLRPEFWSLQPKKIAKNISNIFITFGGTNVASKFVSDIRNVVNKVFGKKTKIVIADGTLNAKRMCAIMIESDLTISAAGQTLYELAAVGCPTVAIKIADNQEMNISNWCAAQFLDEKITSFDSHLLQNLEKILTNQTYEKRLKQSKIGSSLVDGKGALRVAERILQYAQNK